MLLEKKCLSLNVLCGVWMYLCVVIWEMVDLCMFIFLVILCSISGCIVLGL